MTIWYGVYEEKSGRLVSQGTVLADPLPDGLVAVEIAEQNPEGFLWNEKSRAFDIPVKPPVSTEAELAKLVAAIEAAPDLTAAKVAAADAKVKLEEAQTGVEATADVVDGGVL